MHYNTDITVGVTQQPHKITSVGNCGFRLDFETPLQASGQRSLVNEKFESTTQNQELYCFETAAQTCLAAQSSLIHYLNHCLLTDAII